MTRALVVDDSQFMRTVVGKELRDHGYEVVEASNGRHALDAVEEHDPDVITMDVAMPEMDGIEAVEHIMNWKPTPILMVSAYTDDGAEATLDALQKGAVDVIQKPDGEVSIENQTIQDELLEKVQAAVGADVRPLSPLEAAEDAAAMAEAVAETAGTVADASESAGGGGDAPVVEAVADATEAGDGGGNGGATAGAASEPAGPTAEAAPPGADGEAAAGTTPTPGPDVGEERAAYTPTVDDVSSVIEEQIGGEYVDDSTIVLGASTGGPKIITGILQGLPRALDARVLVVQHMPANFTERFAARLDTVSAYHVAEATDGERIGGGEARVAPGGCHLAASSYSSGRLRLALRDDDPVHGVRPSIDVTMRSAAEVIPDPLVGVALTGMGKDGAAGIRALKEAGGTTLVQDETTSPVHGIPQQAIETGCVDRVLPADELVEGILSALTREAE